LNHLHRTPNIMHLIVLLLILLSSFVELQSATPLVSESNSTSNSTSDPSLVESNSSAILSNSFDNLNGTSKVNATNQIATTSPVAPRTFQLFESFVEWILGGLQGVFGKFLVPDSKIFFWKTVANPFRPYAEGTKLYHETRFDPFASSRFKQSNDDILLNSILEALKPKLIDALTEIADSGILQKLHPIVNLTIEAMEENESPDFSESKNHNQYHLNKSVSYDLVSYEDYHKYYKNSGYEAHELHPILNSVTTSVIVGKRAKNITQEFDKSSNQSVDAITNSSLIDNLKQEPIILSKQDNTSQHVLHDQVEFRNSNFSNNAIHNDSTIETVADQSITQTSINITSVSVESSEGQATETPINKGVSEDDSKIVNLPTVLPNTNQTVELESNQTIAGDDAKKFDNNEYSVDNNNQTEIEKPILSLLSCDGDKCEEEFWQRPKNGSKPNYEDPKPDLSKPSGNFTTDVKNFFFVVNDGLIVKPALFIRDGFVRFGKLIKRDLRLLLKMIQAVISSYKQTCRYKFLCLFSSFFSLHTPDFVKKNMPTQVENYYIKIMEAANRHEFLNALVVGYIGFDCNDFYVDPKCPE